MKISSNVIATLDMLVEKGEIITREFEPTTTVSEVIWWATRASDSFDVENFKGNLRLTISNKE